MFEETVAHQSGKSNRCIVYKSALLQHRTDGIHCREPVPEKYELKKERPHSKHPRTQAPQGIQCLDYKQSSGRFDVIFQLKLLVDFASHSL
jgi:hypothetical protein